MGPSWRLTTQMPRERARLTWLLGGCRGGGKSRDVGIRHTWIWTQPLLPSGYVSWVVEDKCMSAHIRHLSPFLNHRQRMGRIPDSLCAVLCRLDLLERKCVVLANKGPQCSAYSTFKYVYCTKEG